MSAPTRLGRYPVRRRLGSGGFATVWLAYDEHLDSPVAIKVLADNRVDDLHVRQRFVEEGRFLRKVESPYVVSVYDAGELDDGRPYLVMAYADQGTLADRLDLAPLDSGQSLYVVSQVAEGLRDLHSHGLLHRDMKPANVLFRTVDPGAAASSNGTGTGIADVEVRAMVGDLGLGKSMDVSSRLTMVAGTPSYVAPEQARGEPLDGRADQYSLAALAYLLLAGRPAWSHSTLQAAAAPPAPPPMGRDVPRAAERVIRRGLSPDPRDRFDDVVEFSEALGAAMGDQESVAPQIWIPLEPDLTLTGSRPLETALAAPAPRPRGRPRRPAWQLGALGAATLAVGAVLGLVAGRLVGGEVEVVDDDAVLSVRVPDDWTAEVRTGGWDPQRGDYDPQPALEAGTGPGWQEDGHGVFAGLLVGTSLPVQVPSHPECAEQGLEVRNEIDGDPSRTVVSTGCGDDGAVIADRVVQAATNRLLWVQVRAPDAARANEVLASVDTPTL